MRTQHCSSYTPYHLRIRRNTVHTSGWQYKELPLSPAVIHCGYHYHRDRIELQARGLLKRAETVDNCCYCFQVQNVSSS